MELKQHVVVVSVNVVRAYLVGVLGVFVALMAVKVSQASLSIKPFYEVNSPYLLTSGELLAGGEILTGNEAHLDKIPFIPCRKITASLFSRNVLRVHHSNTPPEFGGFDIKPANWLTVIADFNKRFFSQVTIPAIDVFYPRSKYRLGAGQESNLIYRFMHAR